MDNKISHTWDRTKCNKAKWDKAKCYKQIKNIVESNLTWRTFSDIVNNKTSNQANIS